MVAQILYSLQRVAVSSVKHDEWVCLISCLTQPDCVQIFCCLFKRLVVVYTSITCVVVLPAVYFTCFDVIQLSYFCEQVYRCHCVKKRA